MQSIAPCKRCRSNTAGAMLVASLALFFTQAAMAETIEVQGNRRVDAETVRSYFHAAADGRFDETARDSALKALLATGVFNDVTIERAGDRLVVHLHEAPVLGRVAFEGNKKIQDKELAAIVESKPQGTLQRAAVQADVGRIMEAYRHKGRDDVGVVPQIINRSDDRVARLDAMCIELVGHAPRIQRKDGLEDAFVFLHRFVNAFG